MTTIRRWYLLLVCAISMQVVTWSIITLLRGLLIPGMGADAELFSFQIAMIIIGMPIFLFHWRWARGSESAREEKGEGGPLPQPLYLHGMLACFIAPLAANTFHFIFNLLRLALRTRDSMPLHGLSTTEAVIHSLIAIGVLSLLGTYFFRLLSKSHAEVLKTDYAAAVRRLFLLGLSAAGLIMTTAGIVNTLHWIMIRLQHAMAIGNFGDIGLAREAARLTVGLPLWMLPWRRAQALLSHPNPAERQSAMRKLYLGLIVLIASLSTITNAALILTGFIRSMLGLQSKGDGRLPLAMMLGMGLIWGYHAIALRNYEHLAEDSTRQTAIQRLYLYLVAGVGLAAFLAGIGGEIGVLIQLVSGHGFGDALREQLSWASATMLAGLPVWLIPWRRAQIFALASETAGEWERRSLVRRIYLYLFLLVATITFLVSTVFIVSQLIELLVRAGDTEGLFYRLAHAIAFSLIAVGVWIYHSAALRGDRLIRKATHKKRITDLKLVVVDDGDGHIGRKLVEVLQTSLPEATIQPLGMTSEASEAMGAPKDADTASQLAHANLIIGPWTIAASPSEIAAAVSASPARKLLIPLQQSGWEWAGVEPWDEPASIQHTLHAAQQIFADEPVRPRRQLSIGALVALIIGGLIILTMIITPLMVMLNGID